MFFRFLSVLVISLGLFTRLVPPLYAESWQGQHLLTEERVLMGTQIIVKAIGDDEKKITEAIEAAFDEVRRLDELMSHYKAESELSRINQNAGVRAVPVSRELYDLIAKSIRFSELTDGAFDISFASVGKLWNFRKKHVPTAESIKAQLPKVNYKKIRLNDQDSSVFLPEAGMEIGLGGIGKGYAMDQAMKVLQKHGIQDAMVMAGGDTLIRGKKGDEPWKVGLRDPDQADGILAVLPLSDQAISTSGDYERFFFKDGVRYHHILDTKTGFPAMACRSVSILAREATTSDALSTSVFVLGPKAGLALIETLEGVDGIIIDKEGKVHLSSGLMALNSEPRAK
ncbi:MAG: FAD:protein FMN transferase [Nitrospirota bacterium]|nr:FAD:protein FMN transferase [Nitrospirota bacterium]